jgi:hypothetical protein
MPVFYNLAPTNPLLSEIQNTSWYNELPVWMAMQEVNDLIDFPRWTKKYKKRSWKPNMGPLLQTVIAERSPKSSQVNTPANMNETTLSTVVAHYERANYANMKVQNFQSFQFHWLPSQEDFRTGQVATAKDDLMRQISFAYDDFIRWQAFNTAPNVYVVGKAGGGLTPVLYGEATPTSTWRDANFLTTQGNNVGAVGAGFLNYEQICAIRTIFETIVGATPWNGSPGTPAENATLKGKFILTGGSDIYDALAFDRWVLDNRPIQMNLLNSLFRGAISDNITFLQEKWPIAFTEAGVQPPEEIEMQLPNLTYGSQFNYEVIPNPDYVNAPYRVAFLEGNEPSEILEIGPPPAPFSQQNISQEKFVKMKWNGEVKLTDNLLINYGNGITPDTNKYGELVQLIAKCAMGFVPKKSRWCLPIIYRVNLTPSLNGNAA